MDIVYLTTDKAGPTKVDRRGSSRGSSNSVSDRNRDDGRNMAPEKLLEADPRKMLMSAEHGDVDALFAFYSTEVNYPEDILPDLFRVAALHLNPLKLEAASKQIRAVARKKDSKNGSSHPQEVGDSVAATLKLALGSLGILALPRMHSAVGNQSRVFNSLITKYWPNIFSAMKTLHRMHSDGEMLKPGTKMGLSSFICGAIGTIFENHAAFRRLQAQAPVITFLWTMWFYGGPPTYSQNDDVHNYAAAARVLARIHFALKFSDALLSFLKEIRGQFGGNEAVAEIALAGVCGSLSSKTHSIDVIGHATMLSVFMEEEEEQIMQAIYAADGMARLIEGMIDALTDLRAEFAGERGLAEMLVLVLKAIKFLAMRNYRYMEQAARCGLLQLLVALEPSKGDLSSYLLAEASDLIGIMPRYLVYYSVIGSFGEEMRKITDGSYPKDAEILKEKFVSEEWRELKRVLLDRYCTKRYYDIVISPTSKIKHCNNCGELEERVTFMVCSGCRLVSYCSKHCQTEDWKTGGHREDCKQGTNISTTHHFFVFSRIYTSARVRSKSFPVIKMKCGWRDRSFASTFVWDPSSLCSISGTSRWL
ncbi:hypothetical protein SCHPADRAFT_502592 [Schizopora paradoxa]|uniref:MYND-type domain-containing protein n=1 Tax=Schizopora paradoxa TaxID=27342 RepID=A0A0H2S168_9AGAM|nr:hypothetical protein SCHPADRAFT_502592 [Schizopora paradoxa]